MLRASRCLALFLFISSLVFAQSGEVRTGLYRGRVVTYTVVNGKAVYEGDILLEHVDEISAGAPGNGATIAYPAGLWPKVGSVFQVPYIIDPASGGVANINAAISQFNATFPGLIQWVLQTTETDFVDINLDPNNLSGQCEAFVGRVGGEQVVGGSASCVVSTILHEMGHTVGMWHEQSRSDRDTYVTVLYQNIIKGSRSNFDQVLDNVQNLTLYDYASVMHYIPFAFSRNGGPALESIPAGMPLSNLVGYSSGDIDAIKRLYGAAPAQVTVTSNPPGLQVIVDGASVTTPQTFSWSLNTAHTFDIPAGPQTLSGVTYTYGRWNDNLASSHTVTVLPGNGELAFPPTSPAVTAYTANFIKLVPYTMTIFPSGTGSVTPTPAPQPFPPATGLFYVARQQITLTASPNAGQNFYAYLNSPFWFPGGISANPKTVYLFDDGTPINTLAEFTSSPVYTVTASPTAANVGVLVDGGFWYAPKSFALPYDSGWTSGSSHTLDISSPQYPFSINTRYAFSSWSDAGAQNHNVTLPSSSTTYTANITPQFFPVDYANQPCAGSVGVTPGSPTGDGFYPTGQLLTFTETPATGWTFTGWQFDLTGTTNPQNLTVSDEVLVVADYNTIATPLSVASLSPSAAVAGGGNFTLTINGAGFTASTLVFINNVFRTDKFVNANTLTVAMTTADLATPGAFQVFVENFPSGAVCAALGARPFFVANHPIVTPTPLSLAFAAQLLGTTSASKSVTLKNNGTTAVTVSSVAASGNFAQTNTCSTLNPGATCKVTVTFAPTVSGAITGAITVIDNAPDSPQVISVTGTGNTPLSIAPPSLAFGTVTVGSTSPAKTVTLTNNQASTLTFSFTASGNYTAVGSGTTPCGTSLAALAKCTMSVTFKPTANGAINGAVTVAHNAAFTPQEVATSGTGASGPTSPLTFNPTSLTFAAQLVGTTSAAKSVTVTNGSASSLTISSVAASGNFTAVASGTTPCTGALAAGASCTFSATFAPSLNGTIKGAAVVTDTAPVAQQILNLTGTAVLPVSFAPATLTFTAQTVGTTSASQTVTMTNNQATTLTISSIGGSGDFTAVAGGTTPCGATLATKKKCTFVVSFTPSAVGTIKGAATVTHNAPNNPQAVTLTGTGQ
jgi:hypothetical protein